MYVVIEIDAPNQSIANLNEKAQEAGKPHQAVNKLVNLLAAIAGGNIDASVKVVVKDASTTINTSGTGSTSETYDLK